MAVARVRLASLCGPCEIPHTSCRGPTGKLPQHRIQLKKGFMSAINFTNEAPPVGYWLAAGGGVAVLAAFIATWHWSTEPPVIVQGRLGAPLISSKALFHSGAREIPETEFFHRVDLDEQGFGESLISADVAWWWPQHVKNAALAFHCAPKTTQDTRQSFMVWTDTKHNVVAYGAALEGAVLPPYATGLLDANESDARQIVHPAARGFRVVAVQRSHTLKIKNTDL